MFSGFRLESLLWEEGSRSARGRTSSRINAAARLQGLSYSRLMDALKKAHVELDRKILADLAVSDPGAFSKIVEMAKTSSATPK